ncbi:MAG: Peroxiredoxin Bcp [Candidatus Thorarchaeota archaeon]|nr:MAG: Peroxiredoxin Bcp [Candidatus Thorarchaeota archaeon]
MPSIGDLAPDFETVDEKGNKFKLADYRGKKIVLYFYPKDGTPGCTAEACSLRDSYTIFQDSGIPIFGMSGGDAESHIKFKEKHNLPFPILMDEDLDIAELYDAKSRLSVIGLGVKRITYLIDEDGRIEAIFGGSEGINEVKSEQHAEQIVGYWGLKL